MEIPSAIDNLSSLACSICWRDGRVCPLELMCCGVSSGWSMRRSMSVTMARRVSKAIRLVVKSPRSSGQALREANVSNASTVLRQYRSQSKLRYRSGITDGIRQNCSRKSKAHSRSSYVGNGAYIKCAHTHGWQSNREQCEPMLTNLNDGIDEAVDLELEARSLAFEEDERKA